MLNYRSAWIVWRTLWSHLKYNKKKNEDKVAVHLVPLHLLLLHLKEWLWKCQNLGSTVLFVEYVGQFIVSNVQLQRFTNMNTCKSRNMKGKIYINKLAVILFWLRFRMFLIDSNGLNKFLPVSTKVSRCMSNFNV